MKTFKLFIASILVLTLSAKISFAANVANEYTIEPSHTNVVWSVDHFGFSYVSGKFPDIEGSIVFNEAKPEKSSVNVIIKTASLSTGISKLDQHLKSADFFDVEKFPTAKFVSKKITLINKNNAKIEGNLTVHGVTKKIVLDTIFNKSAISPINQKPTIGFTSKTTIKRSDFGIKYALPGVGDEVDLVIQAEANR